ncbi:MAG: TIGR00730 family Rossman fold protein [Actinobacteria bacterium]|nr:TIGR00730 family Rossman fold protein [Actinomycetota bacterium]
MPSVAVFCASSEGIDERYKVLAAEVGFAMARRGWTLVSGGGSVSCMGAVARAARAGGSHTIGVIPRALVEMEVADHGADELVVTDDMRERKGEMDRRSDAFLTLPGGIGTLEELLEIWVSRSLGMHDKPVVVLDPWRDLHPLAELVSGLVSAGFVRDVAAAQLVWTSSVDEAMAAIEEAWADAGSAVPVPPTPNEILEAEP